MVKLRLNVCDAELSIWVVRELMSRVASNEIYEHLFFTPWVKFVPMLAIRAKDSPVKNDNQWEDL